MTITRSYTTTVRVLRLGTLSYTDQVSLLSLRGKNYPPSRLYLRDDEGTELALNLRISCIVIKIIVSINVLSWSSYSIIRTDFTEQKSLAWNASSLHLFGQFPSTPKTIQIRNFHRGFIVRTNPRLIRAGSGDNKIPFCHWRGLLALTWGSPKSLSRPTRKPQPSMPAYGCSWLTNRKSLTVITPEK